MKSYVTISERDIVLVVHNNQDPQTLVVQERQRLGPYAHNFQFPVRDLDGNWRVYFDCPGDPQGCLLP